VKPRDVIRIRNTGEIHRLGFQIPCDDFNLTLYKTGAPKEYRSSLSILEGDKAVKQKDIIVNDPLRYRGINIFQSSYGKLPPEKDAPAGHAGIRTGRIVYL
jgi:cytochrome c biogenesis protein